MVVQYSPTETKKICKKYQVTNHDWIYTTWSTSGETILTKTTVHFMTFKPGLIVDTKCREFLDIQFKNVGCYYYRKISIWSHLNRRQDPWGRIFPVYPNSTPIINDLDASWIASKDDYYAYCVNPGPMAYVYTTTLERHRIFCLDLLF